MCLGFASLVVGGYLPFVGVHREHGGSWRCRSADEARGRAWRLLSLPILLGFGGAAELGHHRAWPARILVVSGGEAGPGLLKMGKTGMRGEGHLLDNSALLGEGAKGWRKGGWDWPIPLFSLLLTLSL